MSTTRALSKEHQTILARIQLLERACLDLLKRRTLTSRTDDGKIPDLVEDFLQSKLGIMLHFKVEEEALFPTLRSVSESNETAISALIGEHKTIMQKFSALHHAKETGTPIDVLLDLLRDLSAHAAREERLYPSLIQSLTEEQLKRIDDEAKRLGYAV